MPKVEAPHSARTRTKPGRTVFTLRLGSVHGVRPSCTEVGDTVSAFTGSFSLTASDGFFQGLADPGWAITVATDDLTAVVAMAATLRLRFDQEGIGIEAFGRYLRSHAGQAPGELLAEVQGLASGLTAAYFRTIFSLEKGGATAPLPTRFAIISGWATTGEYWPEDRNRAADAKLHQLLLDRGLTPMRITGTSADGRHSEPSWIVETTVADALMIGQTFLQDAIYWVDSDILEVISCRHGNRAIVDTFSRRVTPPQGEQPRQAL